MTTDRRLSSELPDILGDLVMGTYPEYINDVLVITAQRRQRPAWTFLERWLPMADLARLSVLAPRQQWRAMAMVIVLLALMLVAAVALVVGTRQRLPEPYGPARNGVVAFAADGDIYTANPVSGVASAIVTGPETDVQPRFSQQGTHVVFERKIKGSAGQLYVARVDGTGLLPLTSDLRVGLANYSFSPDGAEVLFTSGLYGDSELWIVNIDGSELRQLVVGMDAFEPSFRPPRGSEVIFAGGPYIDDGQPGDDPGDLSSGGLYAVEVASGVVRTILPPTSGIARGALAPSPDGSLIAYEASTPAWDRDTYRIHVVAADGSGDVALPMPDEVTFQDWPVWSNDGMHLALIRSYGRRNEDLAMAVVTADGRGVGVETRLAPTARPPLYMWAPDDTTILMKPFDLQGQPLPPLLWDPFTGATTPAPWTTISDPTWQRLAP